MKDAELWLTEEGSYKDQFGYEHECRVIVERTIAHHVDTDHYDYYGFQVPIYIYEDEKGRHFKRYAATDFGPTMRLYTEKTSEGNIVWEEAPGQRLKTKYVDRRELTKEE